MRALEGPAVLSQAFPGSWEALGNFFAAQALTLSEAPGYECHRGLGVDHAHSTKAFLRNGSVLVLAEERLHGAGSGEELAAASAASAGELSNIARALEPDAEAMDRFCVRVLTKTFGGLGEAAELVARGAL
jgi:hypothetical protein